ncbi:MAG TPA: dynamin family protein, partial [Allocoleopsis sp.]
MNIPPNPISPDLEKQKWLDWFAGLESSHAEKQFNSWFQLRQRHAHLQSILKTSPLELPGVQADLEAAAAKLAYDRPYRIVVIGESGAGKSTLINAILQRDLLPSETGGAVTGTAVCILPNTSEPRDRAKFEWRSDREFVNLLRELAGRYKVDLLNNYAEPITPQEIFKLLSDQALLPPEDVPDRIRHQLPEELRDIAATWNRLLTAKVNKIPGLDLTQKTELDSVLMESSALNRDERTRLIPGIKYAEYWLA